MKGVPNWEWQDVILLKPGEEFEERVKEQFEKYGRDRFSLGRICTAL